MELQGNLSDNLAVEPDQAGSKPGPHVYFHPDMVVSRDADGNSRSRYGDHRWDQSAKSTDSVTGASLGFFELDPTLAVSEASRDLALLIREQQKALTWLHMDAGRIRAQQTLLQANRALGRWCTKAHAQGLTLFDVLIDPALVAELVVSLNQTYAKATKSLIQTLWRNKATLGVDAHVRLVELKATVAEALSDRDDGPDGHPKLLHLWPPKLLQAGRGDYGQSEGMTRRAAASLRR